MTWVYLNLTRFWFSVPYVFCIEKSNVRKSKKQKSYIPALIFWAYNPKNIYVFFGLICKLHIKFKNNEVPSPGAVFYQITKANFYLPQKFMVSHGVQLRGGIHIHIPTQNIILMFFSEPTYPLLKTSIIKHKIYQ